MKAVLLLLAALAVVYATNNDGRDITYKWQSTYINITSDSSSLKNRFNAYISVDETKLQYPSLWMGFWQDDTSFGVPTIEGLITITDLLVYNSNHVLQCTIPINNSNVESLSAPYVFDIDGGGKAVTFEITVEEMVKFNISMTTNDITMPGGRLLLPTDVALDVDIFNIDYTGYSCSGEANTIELRTVVEISQSAGAISFSPTSVSVTVQGVTFGFDWTSKATVGDTLVDVGIDGVPATVDSISPPITIPHTTSYTAYEVKFTYDTPSPQELIWNTTLALTLPYTGGAATIGAGLLSLVAAVVAMF